MTAHAVAVAAAESAAPNATSPTMPAQAITLRWESTNMVVQMCIRDRHNMTDAAFEEAQFTMTLSDAE